MINFCLLEYNRNELRTARAVWNEGRQDFAGQCPFCQGRWSLSIRPDRSGWQCLDDSCRAEGEVIWEDEEKNRHRNEAIEKLFAPEPKEPPQYRVYRRPRVTTEEFLKVIHGPCARIFFHVAGKTWKHKPKTYDEAKDTLAWLNRDEQEDIYFVVNGGGTTSQRIKRIHSFHIDWDAGRDANGKYYSLDIVRQKKAQLLKVLQAFPVSPSIVVETRNGYQVYWLAYADCTIDQFRLVQERLVVFFESDRSVVKPCQVMRLPNTHWIKKGSGFPPFFVHIIQFHPRLRYSPKDLLDHLPVPPSPGKATGADDPDGSNDDVQAGRSGSTPNKTRYAKGAVEGQQGDPVSTEPLVQVPITGGESPPNNKIVKDTLVIDTSHVLNHGSDVTDHATTPNKKYQKDIPLGDIIGGSSRRACTTTEPTDPPDDVLDWLKGQDLAEYLGLPGPGDVCCPFHADTQPSASIYQSPCGHWMMRCHSEQCSFRTGTIIDVAMHQLNTNDAKTAIAHLRQHYGIAFTKNPNTGMDPENERWKQEQIQVLEENIRLIQTVETMKATHPSLYSMIYRVKEDLILMLEVAKESVVTKAFSWNDRIVFFISLRELTRRRLKLPWLPHYPDRDLKKRINRFCFLKLLDKLADEAVPPVLLERANAEQGKRHREYRIQFYSVAAYTPELLHEAETLAQAFRASRPPLRMSRVALLAAFGEETANRVFPLSNRTLQELTETDFVAVLEKQLVEEIEAQGYTTFKRLFWAMQQRYSWKTVAKDRTASLLPVLLERHGLEQVQTDKELKAKYHLEGDGFPRIIRKKEALAIDRILEIGGERFPIGWT